MRLAYSNPDYTFKGTCPQCKKPGALKTKATTSSDGLVFLSRAKCYRCGYVVSEDVAKDKKERPVRKNPMSRFEAARLLAVPLDVDEEELKRAYRLAALKVHPDRGGSELAMKRVNEANEVLSVPFRRASSPEPTRSKPPEPKRGPTPDRELFETAQSLAARALRKAILGWGKGRSRTPDELQEQATVASSWMMLPRIRGQSVRSLGLQAVSGRLSGWQTTPEAIRVLAEMAPFANEVRRESRKHREREVHYDTENEDGEAMPGVEGLASDEPSPEDQRQSQQAQEATDEGFLLELRRLHPTLFLLYQIHQMQEPFPGTSEYLKGAANDLANWHGMRRVGCPTCKKIARKLRMDHERVEDLMTTVVFRSVRGAG